MNSTTTSEQPRIPVRGCSLFLSLSFLLLFSACAPIHSAEMAPIADPRMMELPPTSFGGQFNPVKVSGDPGVHAFFGTMRCADGTRPKYRLHESGVRGPEGRMVDRYEILCDNVLSRIFFDPHHEGEADMRAVPGFGFEPPPTE